jgi:hypothetical protein
VTEEDNEQADVVDNIDEWSIQDNDFDLSDKE